MMTRVKSILKKAEQRCQANGVRFTEKRKHVLRELLSSDKALSAYEVADQYKSDFGKPIPVMSVYRILEFLESELLVHKLSLTNKYVACSHIGCDHEHQAPEFLICKDCQSVKEVGLSQEKVSALQKNVKRAGYHLDTPQLEMNCICDSCFADRA